MAWLRETQEFRIVGNPANSLCERSDYLR